MLPPAFYNGCMGEAFLKNSIKSVATAAMLLALTRTLEDEAQAKQLLKECGYRFVVTEVGGSTAAGEFQARSTKAVLGAAMNSQLLPKSQTNWHALLHATDEARRGMLVNVASSVSLAVKVALVSDTRWVAVAMFGESAIHPLTGHERAGVGVMHLGREDDPE